MIKIGASEYRTTRERLKFLARFVADIDLHAFVTTGENPDLGSARTPQLRTALLEEQQAFRRLAMALEPFRDEVTAQQRKGVSHE